MYDIPADVRIPGIICCDAACFNVQITLDENKFQEEFYYAFDKDGK